MVPAEPIRKKVGLALSGGAARGLAHIGVLSVLRQEGIPIDMIAGTSAGAVFGAIYASNLDAGLLKKQALELNWRNLTVLDPSFFKSGLIKGRRMTNMFASYLGENIQFSDLKIPFACAATDIDTGEAVVIDRGPVPEALRASISLPGIFTVVKLEGRRLADGGLTTPVPVSLARRLGADFVIAVNVMPTAAGRSGMIKTYKEPGIVQVMLQSLFITTYSLALSNVKDADIVIEPDTIDIGPVDFKKVKEIIRRGEQAAYSAIPGIKSLLSC